MVADRGVDMVGAAAHDIGCLGAAWGYGEPGELEGAGAMAVLDAPRDLEPAVLALGRLLEG